MHTLKKYCVLLVLFFVSFSAHALAPPVEIQVESTWEGAQPQDVQAVLESTITAVAPYLGSRTLKPIIVRNDTDGPISLYKKGSEGEYIVKLDVRGRYWAQMGYQFSHELCHLLSNYDLAPGNVTRQQWFEESLCEAFSLFALERLAVLWQTQPPYDNWKGYAPEFKKYAANMKRERHRSFAPRLSEWYRHQRVTLESDPYAKERRLNEKMASHLLTVFSKDPQRWAAINYINLGKNDENMSMREYIGDWYRYAPADLKGPIMEIEQMLGISNIAKNN